MNLRGSIPLLPQGGKREERAKKAKAKAKATATTASISPSSILLKIDLSSLMNGPSRQGELNRLRGMGIADLHANEVVLGKPIGKGFRIFAHISF